MITCFTESGKNALVRRSRKKIWIWFIIDHILETELEDAALEAATEPAETAIDVVVVAWPTSAVVFNWGTKFIAAEDFGWVVVVVVLEVLEVVDWVLVGIKVQAPELKEYPEFHVAQTVPLVLTQYWQFDTDQFIRFIVIILLTELVTPVIAELI